MFGERRARGLNEYALLGTDLLLVARTANARSVQLRSGSVKSYTRIDPTIAAPEDPKLCIHPVDSIMNPAIDNPSIDSPSVNAKEGTDIASALARWYAAQASIRRLWAIDDPVALIVLVTLEPTSDGDDPFPVWLAKNGDWTSDLRQVTRRDVQLKLAVSGGFDEPHVVTHAALIADVSWRESWIKF